MEGEQNRGILHFVQDDDALDISANRAG